MVDSTAKEHIIFLAKKQPRNAQTNLNAIAVHILKTKENSVNYTEYSTTTARLWQKSCIILYWESR